MATLIQSKQIEGVVTASVIQGDFSITGVLRATGSGIFTNDVTASGVISASRVLGVNYDDISGTPTFNAGTGISITQVGDTITITNTGGGGGVSGSAELINSVALLNAYSASNNLVISGINQTTASLQSQINALISATSSYITSDNTGSDSQTLTIVGDQLTISGGNTVTIPTGSGGGGTTDISSLNTFTSSIQSQVDSLTSATSSYLTSLPSGLVSGSVLRTLGGSGVLSASVDFNTYSASVASAIDSIQHTQIPQGTISSSQQIIDLGFSTTDLTGSDSQTLSIVGDQLTISSGNTITIPTGSGGGTSDFTQLTNVPSGLVSSSAQILGGSGILSGSHPIGNLNDFTQSADTRITNLENFSSSLDSTFATDSELSSLSSSIATTIGNIQHTQIPSGVISGSTFTDFSSSVESRLSTLEGQTDLTGSDTQSLSIVGDQLTISGGNTITIPTGSSTTLPSGLISSSQQISDFGYVTSSLEAPFNGDRVVSNTLLGELYSQSFNAGTTGSLAQFIEQVFFPTTAPTATFSDQTAKFNTNLSTDGTNLVSVSLTDTVDNSPYSLTLSGTNASSLTAVPTNAESSSWEIRANGNLTAGTYSYNVTVGDSTDATRVYSGRSITIAQATSGALTTNGTLYIIESATTGPIYLGTSGRSGTQGDVNVSYSPNYGSQAATNFTSSNPLIAINSTSGLLSVGSAISGSGNVSGNVITSTISWEDQYGNSDSDTISVNVTTNNAPNVSTTLVSNNNTNQATGSSQVVRLTITDTEGDVIPNSGLVWSGYNTTYFTPSVSTPYMYLNVNNTSVPAGTYPYTASLTDEHGFRTREVNGTFTINSADDGTLSGDTSIYIIESATSGDSFRDATGFGNGNLANISVSYSPNYGSQVATLTSSNPAIVVDGSGNLTLGVDLSGSVTQSGDSFTSLISWSDQYGNSDSTTITATVFGNQSPSATFTDNGLTDVTAVSGSNIGSLSITDTESNSPFGVTIGGTDGGKFNIIPQNDASSSWIVQPTGSLSVGDYSVQFTVTDSYSEQAILNETISVSSAVQTDTIYVYTLPIDGTYNNVSGITADGSGTPPEPTIATTYGFFDAFVNSDTLGDSTITVAYGSNYTATLRGTVSGSNVDTILDDLGAITIGGSPASERIYIMIPSGSNLTGVPTSFTISDPGSSSTVGEYILFVSPDGTFQDSSGGLSNDIKSANIHKVTLGTAVDGYTDWFVVGTEDRFQNANAYIRIVPSSGSVPS